MADHVTIFEVGPRDGLQNENALVSTPDKLALIRDSFACKPAVVAETDDYVAIASEFRSLAHLPDIKNAKVFEPAPEEMYVWTA